MTSKRTAAKVRARARTTKRPKRSTFPKPPDLRGLGAEQMLRAMLQSNSEILHAGVDHAGVPLTQQQHRMLQTQNADLLDKLGELTGETKQMPESKIVKLPAFRRVVAEVVKVLEKWPEALVAVGETLARLERGEAAKPPDGGGA
ncbi:MAG: hypothetical protein ABSE49_34780 [Polyangiaceae bacterium]|jgi:hypothetical protein